MFSVDADDSDLGEHKMVLSTESPDTSKEIEFIVEANDEQKDRINSKYNEYIDKYEDLNQNVSGLSEGLSESGNQRLEKNTSSFFSSMESAKHAKENGNLYMVKSHLESIEQDFQSASNGYDEVKKKHQEAQKNQKIGLVLLLFVGLGGGGLAYVAFFSEEYYLDLEDLQEEFNVLEDPVQKVQKVAAQYELSTEPLENAFENFSELLAEEEEEIEEAEQQAFSGFT